MRSKHFVLAVVLAGVPAFSQQFGSKLLSQPSAASNPLRGIFSNQFKALPGAQQTKPVLGFLPGGTVPNPQAKGSMLQTDAPKRCAIRLLEVPVKDVDPRIHVPNQGPSGDEKMIVSPAVPPCQ